MEASLTANGRLKLFGVAYHTFLDRPAEGFGAGTFLQATIARQAYRQRLTRFAHDLPLELGVELGFAGLALGIALYLAVRWTLWRSRGSPAFWLLAPAVAAFLIANVLDWSWHLPGRGRCSRSRSAGWFWLLRQGRGGRRKKEQRSTARTTGTESPAGVHSRRSFGISRRGSPHQQIITLPASESSRTSVRTASAIS